jgi:hypothetical protein
MALAQLNDPNHIWFDRENLDIRTTKFNLKHGCEDFQTLQKKACDCVPAAEYDKRVVERVEDFLRIHNASLLSKEGKLKDKKLLKSFRGKRAQMLRSLQETYNTSMEIRKLPRAKAKRRMEIVMEQEEANPTGDPLLRNFGTLLGASHFSEL